MSRHVRILNGIASGRGSGRMLGFGAPHVFKALQLLDGGRHVSRATFSRELRMGEGAVKTLVSHMRESGVAYTVRAGTHLTAAGVRLARGLAGAIPSECTLVRSAFLNHPANHSVVLRGHAGAIRDGVEQRDYAVMYGARGAITLLYRGGYLIFPDDGRGGMLDSDTGVGLMAGLHPVEGDAVIIASSDDWFVSEMAAKNAALCTMAPDGQPNIHD